MTLRLHESERFEAEIDAVYRALLGRYCHASGEAFLQALEALLTREVSLLEAGMRRAISPEGHQRHRDLYAVTLRSSGAWRILYELRDDDRDGVLDTVLVHSLTNVYGPDVPA